MASASKRRKMSADVLVYIGYLASFVALLYGSTMLFGDNVLTLLFGGFLIGMIGIVTATSRSLLY